MNETTIGCKLDLMTFFGLLMKTLAYRFKFAREKAGYDQAGLARLVGISQQAIHKIESGETKHSKYLLKIANLLNVSAAWLEYGEGEAFFDKKLMPLKQIPIIATGFLKKWGKDFVNYVNRDNCDMAVVTPELYRPDYLAYKIDSDSMFVPLASISFQPGELVIIFPTQNYDNGHFVLAFHKESFNLIFRKFVVEGNDKFLKPLKESYPLLNANDYEIIGICCGTSMYREIKYD